MTSWVYVASGLLSGLAGIVLASRLDSSQPSAGLGYELDAIAAVVIGGASLSGGVGGIGGTVVGVLIIGVLHNGLNLTAFPVHPAGGHRRGNRWPAPTHCGAVPPSCNENTGLFRLI
jgi:ribose/xylose/arabinose/galactoside ABC-type transport system permease subunit